MIISLLTVIVLLIVAYLRPDLLQSLLGGGGDLSFDPLPDRSHEVQGKLQMHFIDVGQGDATLLISPKGETILVDAASNTDEESLLTYLTKRNIKRIDHLFFTHPHEDHIGGGDGVINHFDVGRIYMPDYPASSSTFEKLMILIEEKDIPITLAEHGDQYSIAEGVLSVYGPISLPKDDANNASLILRFVYESTSILFSGDAEKKSEDATLDVYGNFLRSDVYQVGHHGSNTSSSLDFLQAVSPRFAVISCGRDNEYGHPHPEIMERLADLGAKVYRTDLQGSVLLLSDGKTVS